MKCDTCLNSRTVISENGPHKICCLTEKETISCLIGKEDWFVELEDSKKKDGTRDIPSVL